MKQKLFWTMFLCLLIALILSACEPVSKSAPVETITQTPASVETVAPTLELTPEPVETDTPALASTPELEVKTYKIGGCIGWYDNGPSSLYWYEIERYFETLETDTVKYDVTMADGQKNMQVQLDRIEAFIAQDVDALLVSFIGIDYTPEADTVIDMIKSANIPTVFFYMNGWEKDVYMDIWDNICFVYADDSQFGTYTAEIIADMPDKGDLNGDGRVGYVTVSEYPDSAWELTMTEPFAKGLADNGAEPEELLRLSGRWNYDEAYEPVAAALAQFGNKIDVIYCTTDWTAQTVYQVVEDAGRTVGKDIYLVAAETSENQGTDMLERGILTGGVLRNYDGQSHAAVDAAIRYLNGQSNDPQILINHIKVKPLTQEYLQLLPDDLTELDLSGSQISDLTPLEALVKLERLNLSGPHISDFASLKSKVNLKCLYLKHSLISDLTPLKPLVNLEELDLSDIQISDLMPLESLINLKVLNLSHTQASDLTPLQSLTKLEELSLSGQNVNDLTPLQSLKNLKTLYLWNTQVSDLTPLQPLKNMNLLYLYDNALTETQIQALQKELPDCHIYGY